MAFRRLNSPTSRLEVEQLRAGDMFYLTGLVFTARDQAHRRILELCKRGEPLPIKTKGLALFHAGPIAVRRGGRWKVVAIGPTTSYRMSSLIPEVVDATGASLVIGKGGVSHEAEQMLSSLGVAYCELPGGAAAYLAKSVEEVVEVHWLDLGMAEAIWLLRVRDLGPCIVSVDARGISLRRRVEEEAAKALKELLSGEV